MDEATDEPRRPEEDWRGEQIAPRAADPVGGQPVPLEGGDEDRSQALSRRRFLGGAGAASVFLVAGGPAVVAARDEGLRSRSPNPRGRPPTTTPTFLDGNFAPVTEEVTATQLAVTGTIPPELVGRYVRNGPNPVTPPDPDKYHWFTGEGMVHGVRLRDGRAEWYRNRRPRGDDEVPNTHVIGVDGRTFALIEAGDKPVELTYELESLGTNPFDGTLDGSFSAHTHLDPATGDRHAVTYYWEWDDHIRHVVLGPDARVKREVRVPVAGGPMVHDCAITENYVVLFDLPVTFSRDAAVEGAPFPYRWNPDHPPRVGLLPRDGDGTDARWFDAPTCYVLHALNAYETGGAVVIDVVRHPRLFATLLNGPYEGPPALERWTLNLASGALTTDTLDDHPLEFPRIDERLTCHPHRYAYAAHYGENVEHGPAYKHDLATGKTLVHKYGKGRVTLEPLFVPRHDSAAEDDGWVMSFVYDATTNRSDVVILDSQDFKRAPIATIHLPVRVPFGFHGTWIPDP
jgi:carotenoid cleavage dioxygenase-like enzyme